MRRYSRPLCRVALALAAAFSAHSHAAGLGPIALQSRLGHPLQATIPLRDVAGADVSDMCILAKIEAMGSGVRFSPRAAVVRNGADVSIQLGTRESVNEPAIHISVTVECNLSVQRDYRILIDPEVIVPTVAPAPLAAVATDAAAKPAPRAKSKNKAPLAVAATAPAPAAPAVESPPAAAARPQTRSGPAEVSVLTLSTDVNPDGTQRPMIGLKLAVALSAPATETDPQKLAWMREEQRRFAALLRDEDLVETADVALKAAHTRTAALEAEVARLKLQNQSDLASAEAEQKKLYSGSWIAFLLLIVFGCAAAIAALMQRIAAIRKEQKIEAWTRAVGEHDPMTAGMQPAAAVHDADPDTNLAASATGLVVEEPAPQLEADTIPLQEASSAPAFRYSARGSSAAEAHRLKVNEISDALQLAEAWMSFHHPYKVLEILEPFKDIEQPESPIPWICLLDVHRVMGDREKYEAILTRIKKIYNVKMPPWEVQFDAQPIKTLDDFPHIVDRIFNLWDSDQIVPYLDSLLHDQRDGEREGFDLPVYRNILQLISLASEPDPHKRHDHITKGKAYDILFCPRVPMVAELEPDLGPAGALRAGTPELRDQLAPPPMQEPEYAQEPDPAHDVTHRPGAAVMEAPAPQAAEAVAVVAAPEQAVRANPVAPPGSDGEMSAIAIKLHLAVAYQDIGDQEGARILIEEVIKHGNPEQVLKARLLLTKFH